MTERTASPPAGGPEPVEAPRRIEPLARPPQTTVTIPGSKSITNRALLVAALAEGPSELRGALVADDTEAMVDCLARLGVGVTAGGTSVDPAVIVEGCGGNWPATNVELDANQAGTVARFLPPALALGHGHYLLDGSAQLRARPLGPLIGALADLGIQVEHHDGHLPLVVTARGAQAWRGAVSLAGDVSSQFISGLMLAAPLLPAGLAITLTTELVSRPYLEMTAAVMAAFGAAAHLEERHVVVPAGRYRAQRYVVEPDATAASYFFAAAAVTGGVVRVDGLGSASLQGDIAFLDVLAAMGATVHKAATFCEVSGPPPGQLRGVEVDMADISDTAPTFAVVAAFANSPSRARGIGFIRGKESDRIAAVVTELRRIGVDAEEEPDGFMVRPGPGPLSGGTVQTYDDHRIAMSFAVAGLATAGVSIAGPGCVAKTFPGFWDVLELLRS